jgi:cytochrome oxidase Cu insertion factor (SCO1/SenC/PrrC family)
MQNEIKIDVAQQRRGRMIFIMMAIFFIVPIVVVVAMIKYDWRPGGKSQGELVQPPRLIQTNSSLVDIAGTQQSKFWGDKWNMVFVAKECDTVCESKLHDMRQIHVSTYKDIIRVQRVLITHQSDVTKLVEMYPDMMILNRSAESIDGLAQQFNIQNENALLANRVYFVDPLGHIMMSYPVTTPATSIRKDLVRLLKFSWAG